MARRGGQPRSRAPYVVCVLGVAVVAAVLAPTLGTDGLMVVDNVTCETGVRRDCTGPGMARWWLALAGEEPEAIPGTSASTVAAGDGLVFYVEADVVRALDRATGRLRWETRGVGTGFIEQRSLHYGDGLLAVGWRYSPWKSSTACVTAVLDAATGRQLSELHQCADLLMTVVGGAVVFVGYLDVTAVDGRTGRVSWRLPVGERQGSEGALVGRGVLYLASGSEIYRIDLRRGAALPGLALPQAVGTSAQLVSYAGAGALVLESRSLVVAIDADTGGFLWSAPLELREGQTTGVASVDQGPGADLVYLRQPRPAPVSIEAREARTGSVRWSRVLQREYETYMFAAVRNREVVDLIGVGPNTLVTGRAAETGAARWDVRMGPAYAIEPLAAGDPPLMAMVECTSTVPAKGHPAGQACTSRRLVALNW